MNETTVAAADPLRTSDLVPLRRMLGRDSLVLRVNPDGAVVPYQRMPALFFERSIRQILTEDFAGQFDQACSAAIERRTPLVFRPSELHSDEIMINPILDDVSTECRFLVCWVRGTNTASSQSSIAWGDLRLEQVITRYRQRTESASVVVEAAPWWADASGELHELWPHHMHVSAMGLGHAVIQALITDAAEVAATHGGGPAVRIMVPSADMLAGLVPVFHGAMRASGLPAERVIVAVDVALAAEPDLLPVIVHLRTMGMRIDIVGLDAFTATLHTISDTSVHQPHSVPSRVVEHGPWVASFPEAISRAA